MSDRIRLTLLIVATMVAFAANSVLNRLALSGTETGPAAFAALRVASGALVLAALVVRQGGTVRLRAGLRGVNAAALTVYMLGFSFAYVTLDAGLGALILFGGVQVTMFAGAMIAGEVIPPRRWAGGMLAFTGLIWLLWPAGAAAPPVTGAALMLLAAVGWGIYSLKGRGARDPLGLTAGGFMMALLPTAAVFAVWPDGLSPGGAVLAVVSGAITSGLGYAMWYSLLPRLARSVAAVLQLTVPVIAMAGGVAFLGEEVTLRFVIAAALVVGGVALAVTAAPYARGRRA